VVFGFCFVDLLNKISSLFDNLLVVLLLFEFELRVHMKIEFSIVVFFFNTKKERSCRVATRYLQMS